MSELHFSPKSEFPHANCRVCLETLNNNNMVSISKDTIVDGNRVPITEILSCSDVQILGNDKKSNLICRSCLEDGKIYYSLKTLAKKSDKTLNIEIKSIQQSILKSSSNVGSSGFIEICENIDIDSNSKTSNKDFDTKSDLVINLDQETSQEYTVENKRLFFNTLLFNNLDVKKEETESEAIINSYFHCEDCGLYFIDRVAYDNHLELNQCESASALIKEINSYNCEYCEASFDVKKLYREHKKEHIKNGDEKIGQSKCKYCDFVPKNKNNLWRHVNENHSHFKKVSCQLCDMKFFHKRTLKSHMLVHGGTKKFICDFCGKSFLRSSSLISHRRIHTGEKPFKCDVCGLLFGQYNSLKSHKFSHTNEYEHICEICGMKFKRLHDFRRHSKKHLEVKPFPCTLCDKAFTSNYELKMHLQIHTNERKFTCECCGKGFLRRWNLNLHEQKCLSLKLSQNEQIEWDSS